MAVTVYRSSDGSAPTLSGTAGDLITLLDAVLVNGYGAKAAAGWTKTFSGVNKAAYTQGGGNSFLLRAQDDGPGAHGGREARMRGFESMSDVDTGTGDFPTVAQQAAGIIVRKSNTADATTRDWIIVADDRTFYLFVLTGDTANQYRAFGFGDFFSKVSADSFRTMIDGRIVEASTSGANEVLSDLDFVTTTTAGKYMARAHTGLGTAVQFGTHGDGIKGSSSALSGNVEFLNSPDGGLYVEQVTIHEVSNRIRGRLRGFWQFLHAVGSVNDNDFFTGTGDLAGKTFRAIKFAGPGTGVYIIEESDTWESN